MRRNEERLRGRRRRHAEALRVGTAEVAGRRAGRPPTTEPAKAADAGTADSGSTQGGGLGFFCGKLDACCKALAKKGITGSANQCASVVSTKNEFACDTTFQTYKTPDDYYDPPTECL